MTQRKGFTLLELLVAMIIMAILASLIIGNLNSSLIKGRDSQRKNDLAEMQRALEFYYQDNNGYPTTAQLNSTTTRLTGPNGKVYMYKLPTDPKSGMGYTYTYVPDEVNSPPTYYYLYSALENSQDTGTSISQTGFTTTAQCSTATTVLCKYYVSSSNATPLTANP